MSNRVKSKIERLRQAYRNAGNRAAHDRFVLRYRSNGSIARGEGRQNYPYPSGGMSRSVLSLHKRVTDEDRTPDLSALREQAEAMTRDDLRALAKRLGLSGYGKFNKAQLVEAVVNA